MRRWRLPLLLGPAVLALAGAGFAWFLRAAAAPPADLARRTDAILVLTGGAERVDTGLRLLEAGAAPRLLVSGAAPGLTLAELARATGRSPAALAGRVTLGHAAATTIGNAAEAAAYARAHGVRSFRVVTAGYHMPRAMLELSRALPEAELLAHPVGPAALREGTMPAGRVARLMAGEYAKLGLAAAGLTRFATAAEAQRR